jgi:hypothetical protein
MSEVTEGTEPHGPVMGVGDSAAVQGSPEPPPTGGVGGQTVWSDPDNDPNKRTSIAEDPTGESNAKAEKKADKKK